MKDIQDKKIYHLFPGNMKHHTPNMIKYFLMYATQLEINIEQHYFVIMSKNDENDIVYAELDISSTKIIFLDETTKELKFFISEIDKKNALILHSSFIKHIWSILLINRFRGLKNTAWISWGADLLPGKGLKGKVYDFIKGIVINKMAAVSTLDEYDSLLMKKRFGPNIIDTRAFYSQYDFAWKDIVSNCDDYDYSKKEFNILIGNSAWPENKHFEIINKLKNFKDSKINIYCPLGYPSNTEYKTEV
ncbi:TDP-N-acetylfucosamine:lipid II N-acetylfucosaminyltransferase, partial [Sulfurovum riftiae]|uniref:TDP-N-acetylfucosamine:lipid II N-acetylfucosaminyltransferase n=1 Tax=Sulfurovum riftiae TaxID=1630136 RepID=UPI00128EF13D